MDQGYWVYAGGKGWLSINIPLTNQYKYFYGQMINLKLHRDTSGLWWVIFRYTSKRGWMSFHTSWTCGGVRNLPSKRPPSATASSYRSDHTPLREGYYPDVITVNGQGKLVLLSLLFISDSEPYYWFIANLGLTQLNATEAQKFRKDVFYLSEEKLSRWFAYLSIKVDQSLCK